MIIGITGTNAAGKGTVAKFFVKNGFDYYSLSDELRMILREQRIPMTRDSLIFMGTDVRKEHGNGYLTERVLKKVKGNAVIDSVRHPGEVESLKARDKVVMISVDGPVEDRFERAKERNREQAEQSLDAFKRKEQEEMEGEGPGQQLKTVMDSADFSIENSGDIDELYEKLEEILDKIR